MTCPSKVYKIILQTVTPVRFVSSIFIDNAAMNFKTFYKTSYRLTSIRVMSNTFITKTGLFNYIENFTTKKGNFSDKKNLIFFHISAQNIDCGYSLESPRRGGSNEYPQSMFLSKIRKIMYTPVNPSFTIQKWGLRGSKLYRHVFVMIVSEERDFQNNEKFTICLPIVNPIRHASIVTDNPTKFRTTEILQNFLVRRKKVSPPVPKYSTGKM